MIQAIPLMLAIFENGPPIFPCVALNRDVPAFIWIGWGRTVGGGNAADTLQQAMLPVAEHSACSRVNGQLLPVDERSMICAGGQGKGGCQVNNPY